MEIKKLESDGNKLTLLIKKTDEATMNTLRRLIVAEVPTLAIDEVEFVKNDSAMYDEFVAHRLGLIPLLTDLKSYNLKSECKCKGKGCPQCELKITLKEKGDGMVYAESLKSQDPKIKPVYPNTPIVLLLKKQALEFQATAVLGQGKEHIKFSPGLVYYQGVADFEINNNVPNKDEVIASCPKKIIEAKGNSIKITSPMECNLCMACADRAEKESVKVKASKSDFIFKIESWGQLKPVEMLKTACNMMDKKVAEFEKEFKKIK